MANFAKRYFEKAEYCKVMSAQAPNQHLKAAWLKLADVWLEMAERQSASAEQDFEFPAAAETSRKPEATA